MIFLEKARYSCAHHRDRSVLPNRPIIGGCKIFQLKKLPVKPDGAL